MPDAFMLTGKVRQVVKDSSDAGIDQDVTVLTGWVGTLTSNYPKGFPLPDGNDVDYIDIRTITLLSDGSISEDGTNSGISLTAHDPDLFETQLQWTIQPGIVTLVSGQTFRPKKWTFDAPLGGASLTLGDATPVASVGMTSTARGAPGDSIIVIDNSDGTLTFSGPEIADNGDGTITFG